MDLYLVLTSEAYGGPSDLRKVFTNLADAVAQKDWIYNYIKKNDPSKLDDDFDITIVKVNTETGLTSYYNNDYYEFTTKIKGF